MVWFRKERQYESFHYRVNHIASLPENRPENKQLFYTIEVLDEAISRKRQVEFTYNSYGTDKKLHPRLDADGLPKRQTVNPYQMAAANGRYYLICNYDQHNNVVYSKLGEEQIHGADAERHTETQ